MKLSQILSLVALASLGEAATESAKAYIFPRSKPLLSAKAPSLTPTQARLVIAKRLDISQYHQLSSSKDDALAYINNFGGRSQELFTDSDQSDSPFQLVIMLGGSTTGRVEKYLGGEESIKPSFEMSSPPSQSANKRLVSDLSDQISRPFSTAKFGCAKWSIYPFEEECWGVGKNKIVYIDLESNEQKFEDFRHIFDILKSLFDDGTMEAMVIVMPKSSGTSQHAAKPYGLYDMPHNVQNARRSISEEPIADMPGSTPTPALPPNFIPPAMKSISKRPMAACHGSYNSCVSATDNCSGNGQCYLKYNGSIGGGINCFACGCVPSYSANSSRTTYWGGAACSKEDISAQFWLIAGFSILLMGLVSWGLGMLFSVGAEKLPAVIGAGVAGPKPR